MKNIINKIGSGFSNLAIFFYRTFLCNNKTALFIVCGILIFAMNFVSAAVPEEDPFFSIGTDFLEIEYDDNDPTINVLFNNTNIYFDAENDGVWDYKYTRNAGDTLTISSPVAGVISPGARIHSDKPVEYYQQIYYYYYSVSGGYYRHYHHYFTTVPPITSLKNNYYVYEGSWYLVVPEDTTINVDVDNNGSIDNSLNISKRTRETIAIPAGHFARVYSDLPFYLYNSHTVACPDGVDFYIPWESVNIIITKNSTNILVDINNDGHYDQNLTYNAGVYGTFTFNRGAHIHTNKSITVFISKGITMCVPPSTHIGSDLWSKTDGTYSYITGLFENTTYHLDEVIENDLNPEYNYSINANTQNSLPGSGRVHIWGDKPLMETYYYYCCDYRGIAPYTSISSTTYSIQKYLGANELTTMQVRIFNPFANTSISNVNATISFPDDFSIPLGTTIEVNIEKRYIRNDTVIGTDTVTVTPANIGSNYEFTISNTDTNLFNNLDSMQYYDIEYQIKTPAVIGSYTFDPVEVNYDAETWNMPE